MSWKEKASQILRNSKMMPVYAFFGGLSEFWAIVFGISAIVLAFKGKLDANFAASITAITGILAAHDAMDDYHTRQTQQQNTTVVNNIEVQK